MKTLIHERAEKLLPYLQDGEITSEKVRDILGVPTLRKNELSQMMNYLCACGYLVYEDSLDYQSNVYGILNI